MRVLVLGGSRFVGRTIVEAALERGDEVSTLNRGVSRAPDAGVEALVADRTDAEAVRRAIGDGKWDAIIDTWTGAPAVAAANYAVLADRARHFGYVSSWVVYQRPVPPGADESAAVIDGDPDDEAGGFYPTAKRGIELAVERAFGDRALLARCGPTLGPYEDVGSLTWWLRRISRGGRVAAPGRAGDPLRHVDVRDLATWMLDAADRGLGGTFTTVCPAGRHTWGELLSTMCRVTGSDAELVWVSDEKVLAMGVRPYLDLPLWLPASMRAGLDELDSTAVHRAGLPAGRPLADTLADTWTWLRRDGEPPWQGPARGLDSAVEQRLLDQAG